MVDRRTKKRKGEEQGQSRGKKEADLSTGTERKRTKTERTRIREFRQVEQVKEEELLWHLGMEGDK